MVKRLSLLVVILGACAVPLPSRAESARLGGAAFGARFEYMLRLDEKDDSYAWNAAARSASDRSRLMLDVKALDTPYGSLYLKGAARWDMVGDDGVQKRLRFEQGDYLWRREHAGWAYSMRLFANERRFFAHDWTAPLVDDDGAGATGENRGIRADASVANALRLTGLFSLLGKNEGTDAARSRRASYLKALFSHRVGSLSASYVIEDPGSTGLRNRAAVKAELASAYKNVFAAASYQQSGFDDKDLFFPGGAFDWGAWEAARFATVLPPGGAAFAEVRVSSISLSARGEMDLVWRYDAVREGFADGLGSAGPPRVGQSAGAYFAAKDVSVDGRVVYRTQVRSALEDEEGEWLDAGVRAAFEGGLEGLLRGGAGKIRDEFVYETKKNFVHGALRYRIRRFHAGAHAAWSDAGTDYSAASYAWEGKVALNPAWGFHWRLLVGGDYAVGQSAFFRIEYRPSERVFAYAGYGRPGLGDDPFVLEDAQMGLLRTGHSEYTFVVRGDF